MILLHQLQKPQAATANAVKTAYDLANTPVPTARIADLAVTAAKIANSAITGAKIASATIAQGNIANNAIGTNTNCKCSSNRC